MMKVRVMSKLSGSARTAEVGPIADLSRSAEKYIEVRQEGGEKTIPDEVVTVFKEIERAISGMLSRVEEGQLPESNKALLDKIHKIVQQEIQAQLQQSLQDNTATKENYIAEATSAGDSLAKDSGFTVVDEQSSDSAEKISNDIMDLPADAVSDEPGDKSAAATVTGQSTEQAVEMSYGDIDDELIDIFLEEAEELLENCEHTIDEIKNTPNSTEHIQQLQRNMHTLKGGARMADLTPVGDLTHNLESLVVMVSDRKVDADKILFNLLQESLDVLTNMLANVKNRQPLMLAGNLNDRIEMLMRGELEEKRAVERFDIELSELESEDVEEPEAVEEPEDDEEPETIETAHLLPGSNDENSVKNISLVPDRAPDEVAQKKTESKEEKLEDRPHWGQRVTDVNFKDSQEQVRVRSDLLNNLVNYAGEVNIYHARMGKQVADFSFNLSELTQTVVRLKEQLRKLEIETEIQIRSGYEKESDNYDDDFDPLEMDQYSTLQQLTRSLSETAADVRRLNANQNGTFRRLIFTITQNCTADSKGVRQGS